jgi:FAD binding domain
MKRIRVDSAGRTVWAEGGVLWRELDHETQAFGLATTGGTVSNTGIGGLTLGGGLGWLMGKHGLTVDNLISVDVVTADGQLRKAGASDAPDLFWALRGGGGNFVWSRPAASIIATAGWRRKSRLPPGVPATPSPQARGFASLSGTLLPPAGAVGPKMGAEPVSSVPFSASEARCTRPANRPRPSMSTRKGLNGRDGPSRRRGRCPPPDPRAIAPTTGRGRPGLCADPEGGFRALPRRPPAVLVAPDGAALWFSRRPRGGPE